MRKWFSIFFKAILYISVAILGGVVFIFNAWCTIIAFIGGTIPIIGLDLSGGLFSGLIWLFIVDPIVMTVIYWVGMVFFTPLSAIANALSGE